MNADWDNLMENVLSLVYDRKAAIQTSSILGRESWNQLPPQPEPKIATYLQSIIEGVLDFILPALLTLSCHHSSCPF